MFKNWLLAIRPKTLPAAIAPVMMGTAMALGDGGFHWPSAAMALIAALLLQIGTNLVNDYCDFKKGADTSARVGPLRVTQSGLIKPDHVLKAAIFVFVLCAIVSMFLIIRGGMAIALVAVASILSGIFYTAGRRSLGYLGLGDVFVLIFFGPVAVAGTYYVQTLDLNLAVIVAGFGPGFLSMAILAVNNLRDADGDRKASKMTLAVRFGTMFAAGEYVFCIIAAALTPFFVDAITRQHPALLVASVFAFGAIPLIRCVYTQKGAVLNAVLARTGFLLLVYSLLFSMGWLWCSR